MSQPPGLSDRCVALCQCSIGKAEPKQDNPQIRLGSHLEVDSDLMGKGAVGDWIIKRKRLFQVRPGGRKLADKHQVVTGGEVTQNEPGGIVALTAQTQQILIQAQRQVEFAPERVIARLP